MPDFGKEIAAGNLAWPASGEFTGKCRIALLGNFAKFQSMKRGSPAAPPKSPADFLRVAAVFKALSNPNRLLIVDELAGGERCEADLTTLVGLDMSTVSSHLAVLRNAGIIGDQRRGTRVFYSLRRPCLMNVFRCLDDFHAADGA